MEFYTINELATRWGKTERGILQMIFKGQIAWWLPKPVLSFTGGPLKDDYDQIEPVQAKIFIIKPSSPLDYYYGKREPCRYHLEDFVVFSEEVDRVEKEIPALSTPMPSKHDEPHSAPELLTSGADGTDEETSPRSTNCEEKNWTSAVADSPLWGKVALCNAFDLGENSFTAVERRVEYANTTLSRDNQIVFHRDGQTPGLTPTEILTVKVRWGTRKKTKKSE